MDLRGERQEAMPGSRCIEEYQDILNYQAMSWSYAECSEALDIRRAWSPGVAWMQLQIII